MKKIVAIILLVSGVNALNGATWAEMIQEAVSGKPAAVSTVPAASTSSSAGWADTLKGLLEDQSAVSTTAPVAVATAGSSLEQLRAAVPAFIENIKKVVAKLDVVQDASKQGLWSGLKAAFTSVDTQTAQAFSDLKTQAGTVVAKARELLNSTDMTTRETVKSLLKQVTQAPQFQKLVEYTKSMPFTGNLNESLTALMQESESGK